MADMDFRRFEDKVRDFLSTNGFVDVGGGSKFKIGDIQVDACGGVEDYLVIIDATTTRTNINRKITDMRGKLPQFKTFKVENEGVELSQFKKYKEVLLVVATNSSIDSGTQEKALSFDPQVRIWDKQFFEYYRELKKLIRES